MTLMPFLTSLPFVFWSRYEPMEMQPFRDLIMNYGDAKRQIVLNIIMMMPFGFLFPAIKEARLTKTVLVTFLFSLSIELVQPLLGGIRRADITDLITNTIGGLLGYLVYKCFKSFVYRFVLDRPQKALNSEALDI